MEPEAVCDASSDAGSADQCAICLGGVRNAAVCRPCGHRFCGLCLRFAAFCKLNEPATRDDAADERRYGLLRRRCAPCPTCRRRVLWTQSSQRALAETPAGVPPLPGCLAYRFCPGALVDLHEYCAANQDVFALSVAGLLFTVTVTLALNMLASMASAYGLLGHAADAATALTTSALPVALVVAAVLAVVVVTFVS